MFLFLVCLPVKLYEQVDMKGTQTSEARFEKGGVVYKRKKGKSRSRKGDMIEGVVNSLGVTFAI